MNISLYITCFSSPITETNKIKETLHFCNESFATSLSWQNLPWRMNNSPNIGRYTQGTHRFFSVSSCDTLLSLTGQPSFHGPIWCTILNHPLNSSSWIDCIPTPFSNPWSLCHDLSWHVLLDKSFILRAYMKGWINVGKDVKSPLRC